MLSTGCSVKKMIRKSYSMMHVYQSKLHNNNIYYYYLKDLPLHMHVCEISFSEISNYSKMCLAKMVLDFIIIEENKYIIQIIQNSWHI